MRQKFISLVLVDHIKRKLGRLLAINFDGKIVLGCFRLGNLDSNFKIRTSDLIAIEREIRKRISTLRYLFLDSLFSRFLGKPEQRTWKTVLKNSGLTHGTQVGKKKTTGAFRYTELNLNLGVQEGTFNRYEEFKRERYLFSLTVTSSTKLICFQRKKQGFLIFLIFNFNLI